MCVRAGEFPTYENIPVPHWHFIKHSCIDWYEIGTHVFVHANLHPGVPFEQQLTENLHWLAPSPQWHRPHVSGKVMICGHTEQRSGIPLCLENAVCIDTWAYGGGWLTCLDVSSGEYWQANEFGRNAEGVFESGVRETAPGLFFRGRRKATSLPTPNYTKKIENRTEYFAPVSRASGRTQTSRPRWRKLGQRLLSILNDGTPPVGNLEDGGIH